MKYFGYFLSLLVVNILHIKSTESYNVRQWNKFTQSLKTLQKGRPRQANNQYYTSKPRHSPNYVENRAVLYPQQIEFDGPVWDVIPPKQQTRSFQGREKVLKVSKQNLSGNHHFPLSANMPKKSITKETLSGRVKPYNKVISDNPTLTKRVDKFNEPSALSSSTQSTKHQNSPCNWAIISCCSALSTSSKHDCFEQLGCKGPFWGNSPCEEGFVNAAVNNANRYYGSH